MRWEKYPDMEMLEVYEKSLKRSLERRDSPVIRKTLEDLTRWRQQNGV